MYVLIYNTLYIIYMCVCLHTSTDECIYTHESYVMYKECAKWFYKYLVSTYTNYMGTVLQVFRRYYTHFNFFVIDLGEKKKYYFETNFNWVLPPKFHISHVLLLMLQKFGKKTHLGSIGKTPCKSWDFNFQPQLVIAGFLNHQLCVTSMLYHLQTVSSPFNMHFANKILPGLMAIRDGNC